MRRREGRDARLGEEPILRPLVVVVFAYDHVAVAPETGVDDGE